MDKKNRRAIIAGNWKMNMLTQDVRDFAELLKELVPAHDWCGVMLFTPFTLLPAAAGALDSAYATVGAQTVSEHKSGAYTGEVSAAQLTDVGATAVIIGHSERRAIYGETDAAVRDKLKAALEGELTPVLCVGENLTQRETGITRELIAIQVKEALLGVTPEDMRRVIIAYEPVWAIGTGRAASPEDAQEVCRDIRAVLGGLYGEAIAVATSILYGGSVTPENSASLFAMPDIDGALVGGASLDARKFAGIINAAKV